MKKVIFYFSVFTIILCQSCAKEDELFPDLFLDYNTTSIKLENIVESPGKVVILEDRSIGIAGLVFYNDGRRILAYDRCSSVNPEQRNSVVFLAGSLVEDKVSGALFDLKDGSAAKFPAVRNLKRYNVSVNGIFIRVTN